MVVTSRWLYKLKHAADASVEKYKAKFVVWGFSQVEGTDYDETFASVARYTSIRSLISIAAEMGWKSGNGLEDPSDGCEDRFSQWDHTRGDLH